MDLYLVDLPYTSLGCWKDKRNRAIKGSFVRIGTRWGKDAVKACYERAKKVGSKIFAVQSGNECFADWKTAGGDYKKHGKASNCKENGTGGHWANSVFEIGIAHFYSS